MHNPTTGTLPTLFTFTNGKPHPVRVHTDDAGEPLFHAGDLCELLEHGNPHQALKTHVEPDDLQKMEVIDRLGRKQQVNFVREPGMWSLLLGSHAPNAKKVKAWITGEVLPAIRKTGRYVATAVQPLSPPLTSADLTNLRWAVRSACHGFHQEAAANAMVWRVLRRACNRPAPDLFREEDIPTLAAELTRLVAASWKLSDFRHRLERAALTAMSQSHGVDDIIDIHRAEALALMTQCAADFTGRLEKWQQFGLARFVNREAIAYQPQGDEA